MKQYSVTGMSCAACSSHIEKAVKKLDGVTEVSVSLLTNSMAVEGTADSEEIVSAVENAGYGAQLKESSEENKEGSTIDELKDIETPKLKKRLIASICFLVPLMYLSMGHMMWNWPIPKIMSDNHIAMGILQMLITILIMVINQNFFISGFKSLWRGMPNMDTLVALGASAAFGYSAYILFAMTAAQVQGNNKQVLHYMHEFYFESAAMILTLITLGKMLEAYSKGKTTDALKSLMKLSPKTAVILKDNVEVNVNIEEVKKGDVFVVRPGESIPVDGVVIEGESAVNEAALTGESIPVDKITGSKVSAATINQSGFLKCEATRVGNDTTLSQIIEMVGNAAATKAPIAKAADKVSGVFVPIVIVIALLTMAVWVVLGADIGFALSRGIAVLVISCPCALGLATPVAIMVGNGVGAKHGILFKNAASLEMAGKTEVVVFDKTGTITCGKPKVTDIICANDIDEKELLVNAYSLEVKSEHPLAKAIVEYAEINNIQKLNTDSFETKVGNGVKGIIDGSLVIGGNIELIENNLQESTEKIVFPDDMKNEMERLAKQGKTPLIFAKSNQLLGIIAVADVIKEDSPSAVKMLKDMGIKVVMLTGDNEQTAEAIGRQVGVDNIIANVLPGDKEKVIKELKIKGRVTMVGDGINDAPALTSADVGVAIGNGTDVAMEAAEVVLMKSNLSSVPVMIKLSRKVLKNIHENLFWAFIYNIIGIPLAAGVWYSAFGLSLSPMFGAAAMSLSSFCVVTNALRLNWFKVKEKEEMKKAVTIKGMMCEHCEARVKKALETMPEVNEAVVSHKTGTALVRLNKDVEDDTLKKRVEECDYTVESIK